MILGVIPARLNSTRFPNKIIFPLNGKPIIEHVYEKVIQSKLLSKVVVAIDSETTKESINCLNIVMTSDKHQSGTDRVAEVSENYDCDIVINIQGDEPGIDPDLIDKLITLFDDAKVEMASVASTDLHQHDFTNDNVVKVNLDNETQKSGVSKEELKDLFEYCCEIELDVLGLMCIPPNNVDPNPFFEDLKNLNDKFGLSELSMGMSSDYEIALKNSSTYLRICSDIFGKRS